MWRCRACSVSACRCRYVTAARSRRALRRTISYRPRRRIPPRLSCLAAVALLSYRCVAPPAVSIQLASCVLSYAIVALRRCIPAASLHYGRGVCFDGHRPQPNTRVASSSAVQTRLAQLWRLLPSSSNSSSTSTSSCDCVPFVCLRGVHLHRRLRPYYVGGLSGGYFENVAPMPSAY
jgi:hypothetical protein